MPEQETPGPRFNRIIMERGLPPFEIIPWEADYEHEDEEEAEEEEAQEHNLNENGEQMEEEDEIEPQDAVEFVLDSDESDDEPSYDWIPGASPQYVPDVGELGELYGKVWAGRTEPDTETEDSDSDASR